MNWRLRAAIIRMLAEVPGGRFIYQRLQSLMGLHRNPRFLGAKMERFSRFADGIRSSGIVPLGKTLMEVGTGSNPLYPIAFWCLGAESVHTFDVTRQMLPDVFGGTLRWICAERERLMNSWEELAPESVLRQRFDLLSTLANQPAQMLEAANINYCAPTDAAISGLPDDSIDIHYSSNVLEHIPEEVIGRILKEAFRVVKPTGLVAHHIDPSDHFSHFDKTITAIHFLQFSDREWQRIAGNSLSYHNRLRDSQFAALFRKNGLHIIDHRFGLDERSVAAIRDGFPLDTRFASMSEEDLCRRSLDFVARVSVVRRTDES